METNIYLVLGASSGGSTQTYSVAAGSQVGFKMDQTIFHAGPILAYISKAPSSAASYDGSGQWAKIYQIAPQISNGQINWNTATDTFNFRLPSSLAAGEYLLRIEHIALHVIPQSSCLIIPYTNDSCVIPVDASSVLRLLRSAQGHRWRRFCSFRH